jgi:hypothetical protein
MIVVVIKISSINNERSHKKNKGLAKIFLYFDHPFSLAILLDFILVSLPTEQKPYCKI